MNKSNIVLLNVFSGLAYRAFQLRQLFNLWRGDMRICVSAYIKVQAAKVLETFNIPSANISRVFKLNAIHINLHTI